jgi:hypothetical protein
MYARGIIIRTDAAQLHPQLPLPSGTTFTSTFTLAPPSLDPMIKIDVRIAFSFAATLRSVFPFFILDWLLLLVGSRGGQAVCLS